MYFKVPNKGTYLQESTQEVSGNRVYQFFGPFLIQLWREQIVGTIGLKNVQDLGKERILAEILQGIFAAQLFTLSKA